MFGKLIDVLQDIKWELSKIERNQRYHTKVVQGARVLTVPFAQVKDLKTGEEVATFVRANGGSL